MTNTSINHTCVSLLKTVIKTKGLENNLAKIVLYSIIIPGSNCNELFWNSVHFRAGRKCVKCQQAFYFRPRRISMNANVVWTERFACYQVEAIGWGFWRYDITTASPWKPCRTVNFVLLSLFCFLKLNIEYRGKKKPLENGDRDQSCVFGTEGIAITLFLSNAERLWRQMKNTKHKHGR